MKIHFITSNKGKIKSLNSYFQNLGRPDVEIIPTNLNLIEPQADTVAEVSLFKARQAFQQLKEPVLVEDGGFAIEALNGFPGVYTKYANQTLGAKGYIKLMDGVKNRNAKFLSTATYIDASGSEHQFHRKGGEVSIAQKMSHRDSPLAWSVLWKVIWIERFKKVMADMTEEEVLANYTGKDSESSLNIFAEWFVKNNQSVNSNAFLGHIVTVDMDRKLGTKHPKHGFVYEVNYGRILNTISGDGEELDAYVLGVDKPMDSFTGRCIAIIHRTDDNDDKLVVAPDGINIADAEIDKKTAFQEQWFKHIIIRKQK